MTNQIPNEEDLKLSEAKLSEVVKAYRKSRWNNDVSYSQVKDFLSIENIEDVVSIADIVSPYVQHVVGVVFEDFLSANGYRITRQFSSDGTENLYPYSYESIEIEYKVNKKIINDGMMLVTGKDLNFVFACSYFGHDTRKIELLVDKQNETKAEKILKDLKDYAKANNYLKNKKITPDFSFIEINKNYTWDSVILDTKTKDKIFSNLNVILNNLDIYTGNNIAFKRGIILKGVPGVGKTLIGKILCNVSDITLLWVTPKHLERSSNISMIGELARELSPTILFLEDIDLYGEKREMNGDKTLLGELMNQLDGIEENKNVIVIATTNKGDDLEVALRNRPGRFDISIEIPKPDKDCRKKMLEFYSKNFNKDNVNFDSIAEGTGEKYTGAHIKDLVDLAVMSAIDEKSLDNDKKIILKQHHFSSNIKTVGEKKIAISDAFHQKGNSETHIGSYLDD